MDGFSYTNLTSRVHARNITTSYTYDALNRKLTEVAPNINYEYWYDTVTGSGPIYNSVGRLSFETNMVDADEVYSYDPMGRLNWEASWTPSQPNNTNIIAQAQYDKAGEMTQLTYPDGRVVTNTYPSGQLNSVTCTAWCQPPGNVAYVSGATYGPPGNLTGETFGNGVQMVPGNNSRLLLDSLLYKTSAQTLWSKQYTWAANGMNLTQMADLLNSANTMNYTYDPDNRIATASGAGASETYSADAWGNLQQGGHPFTFTQSFNVNNRISTGGYSYDAAGDVTKDGDGTTYTYDADGMITASGGVTYNYDALDQRMDVFGGSNPGETIFFNGTPIALHDPSTGAYTDLIYANGQMIAEVAGTQTAVPTYRAEDHLGSLSLQTDNSGNVTGSNTFLPFGQFLNTSTTDEFQFTELPQDAENSSYHAGYRNFSYEQGRWLSPDPSNGSYDITNPQSFNRYSYVMNNPMASVDPSGLGTDEDGFCDAWWCFGGGGSSGFGNGEGGCGESGTYTSSINGAVNERYSWNNGPCGLPSYITDLPGGGNFDFGGGVSGGGGGGGAGNRGAGNNPSSMPNNSTPQISQTACKTAATAAGAAGGALVGGAAGGVVGGVAGGAGGTLVAPGVGTVGGGVAGAEGGATAGAWLGGLVGGLVGNVVGNIMCSSSTGGSGNYQPNQSHCDAQLEADLNVCRAAKSRACYTQAYVRHDVCSRGLPVPPLNF